MLFLFLVLISITIFLEKRTGDSDYLDIMSALIFIAIIIFVGGYRDPEITTELFTVLTVALIIAIGYIVHIAVRKTKDDLADRRR